MSEQNRIPQHVAIIMDGNGRWAELRGKERYEGHVAGVEPVRASLRAAARWGVKYLTLYAFSTENWGRPAQEVDALMELFCKSVVNETPELIRQGVEIRMIGDRTRFSEKVQRYLAEAEQRTAGGKTLTLILALNYSSRSEITRAVRQIAARAASGELAPEEISEGTISAALDTAPYPNPDRPHERRTPAQQLPALAGVLRRTLLPGGAVARFHRGGVRPCNGGIRPARPPFRAGKIDEVKIRFK